MSRTVTLAQLKTDIAYQADVVIGSTGRYQASNITRLVNQSIQRFRQRISQEGITHYLVAFNDTLTVGATAPYAFLLLDLSAISPTIQTVYGLDVTMDGFTRALQHRPFTQRDQDDNIPSRPRYWSQIRDGQIAIFPPPDGAYQYSLWYLPTLADLVNDSDTFDGVAGWEDFIVWDVVCRLIHRDAYPAAYQMAEAERDGSWSDILRGASRVSANGPTLVGRDSLANTKDMRSLVRIPFWPFALDSDAVASVRDPSTLGDLLAWFDASQPATIALSGANVTGWTSTFNPGGGAPVLSTASNFPQFSAMGWNGTKPAVVFTRAGFQNLIDSTSALATYLTGNDVPFTIGLIANIADNGHLQHICGWENTGGGGSSSFEFDSETTGMERIDFTSGGAPIVTSTKIAGKNFVYVIERNNHSDSFVNDSQSINNVLTSGASVSTRFVLGMDALLGFNPCDLTISELIIYKSKLGSAAAGDLYTYFKSKWGGL